MVLVRNWPFFQLFFQAIQAGKMSFTLFQNEKTHFQAIKTTSSKSRKNDIFPKGLTHMILVQKWPFFEFSFQPIKARKMSFTVFQNKKKILAYKNKKFKKSKNSHFSKGVNPWFQSKNGHFYKFFFLAKMGQENVFYDILERKNAFLGYKNKKFKKSKN